jgi:DNA-binding MltR family transcriptional regulator
MTKKKRRRPPRKGFDEGRELSLSIKLALESDRGCVLVAAAAIDEALSDLLRAYFEKTGAANRGPQLEKAISFLLEARPLPPLGTFGVRASLCYVLALIDTRHFGKLTALTEIRNPFAHPSEPAEITEEDITALTLSQNYTEAVAALKQQGLHLMDEDLKAATFQEALTKGDSKDFSAPRRQFMALATVLYLEIRIREAIARGHDNQDFSIDMRGAKR